MSESIRVMINYSVSGRDEIPLMSEMMMGSSVKNMDKRVSIIVIFLNFFF